MDRDEILRVFEAFRAAGLEYTLIGATAMGVHGVVRATEDIDLFIRATAENVDRLRQAFRAAYGNDPSIDEITAADLLGEYPAVRYYPPSGDLYFDVMTRLGEAATFDTVEAEVKLVAGDRCPWLHRWRCTGSRRAPCARRTARTRRCSRQRFALRDEA